MAREHTLLAEVPLQGGPVRVEWTEDGVTHVIQTTAASLGELLRGAPEAATGDEGGWQDFLGTRAAFAFRARPGEKVEIVFTVPTMERVIHAVGSTVEELPVTFPALMWVVSYVNGHLARASVFVTSQRILSVGAQIPAIPFPWGNANSHSGQVCWGTVGVDHLTPQDPWLVDEVFFASNFNNDLWSPTRAGIVWERDNAHWKALERGEAVQPEWGGNGLTATAAIQRATSLAY